MVQIAPVNYEHAPAHFDYLKVERTGGIAGVHEQIIIEKDFTTRVQPFLRPAREYQLDAVQAEELIHALAHLADGPPPEPGVPQPDRYAYVLELRWNGRDMRFHIHDATGDATIRGVLDIIGRLLDRGEEQVDVRTHG